MNLDLLQTPDFPAHMQALIQPTSRELPKNSSSSLSSRMQTLPLNTTWQHLGSVWILKYHMQAIQVSLNNKNSNKNNVKLGVAGKNISFSKCKC